MVRGKNPILDNLTLPLCYEHMQDKLLDFTNLQENSQKTGVHGVKQRKEKKIGLIPAKCFLSLFSCLFLPSLSPYKTIH